MPLLVVEEIPNPVELESEPVQPEFGKIPFVRNHHIPSIEEMTRDPSFNPSGARLSSQKAGQLENLRISTKRRLAECDEKLTQGAIAWAKQSVDIGQYKTVYSGKPLPSFAGKALLVGFNKADRPDGQVVIINPGDCAELDLIAFEQAQVLASFHATVKDLFSNE